MIRHQQVSQKPTMYPAAREIDSEVCSSYFIYNDHGIGAAIVKRFWMRMGRPFRERLRVWETSRYLFYWPSETYQIG